MRGDAEGTDGELNPLGLLTAGAREYHSSTTDRMRSVMSRLSHSQHPAALFITCADSRVAPNGEESATRASKAPSSGAGEETGALMGLPAVEALHRLAQANVEEQIGNLMGCPMVRERVDSGELELSGMY